MTETVRYPDVKAVRLQARAEWERTARRHMGIQERIGLTVPYWLVLIAGAFFLLSAPHTAGTFDKLTPGWGWVAPIAVEFSLLYAAFRKALIRQSNQPVPSGVRALEGFAFIVAVIVNGAGSFMSVVESIGVNSLSFAELGGKLGTLPASSQVALMLVPLASLIIPIGTGVAGEGVAALITERRETGSAIDQEWRRVSVEIEFTALRDAAVANGVQPGMASRWAASLVASHSAKVLSDVRPSVRELPETTNSGQVADVTADNSAHGNGHGYARKVDARAKVRSLLETDPNARSLSVRALAEASEVGKTVAAEVLNEWKLEHQEVTP